VPSKELFIPELVLPVANIARKAGALIMGHYQSGGIVGKKADASPVTEADRAADRLIVEQLKLLAPAVTAVSEEGEKPDVSGLEYFWLIDPLDGTKSFVRGTGYFTVNIALIRNKAPVMGVIYDPANDTMYYGSPSGAFRKQGDGDAEPIHTRGMHTGKLAALVSHSHLNKATEDYLALKNIGERIPCASSIKFCWLAEGNADLYPRFGPTMEWDTAAGHAILIAAGGNVTTPDGAPFLYGKKGFENGNFVASGKHLT
jgi:3'(2'), 5'-bisphosphate nucleotidase